MRDASILLWFLRESIRYEKSIMLKENLSKMNGGEVVVDFNTLINSGVLNHCKFVEIIQIILLHKKDKTCWNYFTHLLFSATFTEQKVREYLTASPQSINPEYQIIITREIISKTDVLNVLQNAVEKQKWEWKDDVAVLDDVFPIATQFIPEMDPTGNKTSDSTLVPIEQAMYGSNFMGGYYVCELFSAKTILSASISVADRIKIQEVINKSKIGFDIESLSDRIGNIVCKIPMDIIKHKLVRLSPERGIAGQFTLKNNCIEPIECLLQIILENDNTIIETRVEDMVFSEQSKIREYCIDPNRYINRVILSDKKSGIIYYAALRDYSFGSNYYLMITSPRYGIQSSLKRTIIVNDKDIEIELTNIASRGEVSIKKEIYEMEKRQHKWMTEYGYKHHFFKSFVAGQEKEAVQTVVDICNDRDLLWDLEEVWLVDPYLSADDILRTVVYCEKYGISIKCLTHIASINGNRETRTETPKNGNLFEATVSQYRETLKKALNKQKDLKIEYRTVAGKMGNPFHDRYLILKYDINKSRAWSLGISVNSLGKSHHIIQIVQSPMDVIETIDAIWNQALGEKCLIFKN